MLKILKYSFYDLARSRSVYAYFIFYTVFTLALMLLIGDHSKVVLSLMNVILILCPLIATVFGVMYYYNSRDFAELLLAQPIRRVSIFWGQYLGMAISLSVSLLLGVGLPFVFYGVFASGAGGQLLMLLAVGVLLTFIFSGIAFFIALRNENRIKGFAFAIGAWLLFAVIYDGLFLLSLVLFQDYPLENYALGASLFNPIDLSRILILLQLDISALLGYTGAVFQQFFGSIAGVGVAFVLLLAWVLLPAWGIKFYAERKDF